MIVGKIIKIEGRVQNVGFRYSTHEKAEELSIKGFVKNQADGSVYIEAEGDVIQVELFVEWCKKGSIWARVDRIHVWDGAISNYKSFDIK